MKKMLLLALSITFILSGTAFAQKFNDCTVKAVNGDELTLICKDLEKTNQEVKAKEGEAALVIGDKARLSRKPRLAGGC